MPMSYKLNDVELLNVLLKTQIVITLITETHCKLITTFYFPSFKMYRADLRDKTGYAGSAIIISTKIQHLQFITCNQIPIFQSSTIQIKKITTPSKYIQDIFLLVLKLLYDNQYISFNLLANTSQYVESVDLQRLQLRTFSMGMYIQKFQSKTLHTIVNNNAY